MTEAGSPTVSLAMMETRRDDIQKTIRKMSIFWYVALGAAFILLSFSILMITFFKETGDEPLPIVTFLFVYGIMAIFIALYCRERLQEAQSELRELLFEIELASYTISERQVRAERLFRRNEHELLKYYNMNLRQNRWIMFVGIMCIVASVLIVIGTLWAVMGGFDKFLMGGVTSENTTDVWLKGIAGAIGGVGAIMINVVAAIYLQMHGRASDALGQFHGRLVKTHELFMSNVLASRIDTDDKRESLLAELAKGIVRTSDDRFAQPASVA